MSSQQLFGVGAVQALTDGATITVDQALAPIASANALSSGGPSAQVGYGNAYSVTLGGNRNLNLKNPIDGQIIHLFVTQDGTGSRTLTILLNGTGSLVLTSGTPLTTTAAAVDLVALQYRADIGKVMYYPIAKNLA